MKDRKAYDQEYKKSYRLDKKQIKPTFSVAEFAQIQQMANEYGLKPATFVREITLSALSGKVLLDEEEKQELRNVSYLIRNISSNVNQMAKHSNTLKGVVDEVGVLSELRHLENLVKQYVQTGKPNT